MRRIGRALLSVHDKTGVADLARALTRHGCELLSTGGTAALLEREGIPVVPLAKHTGAPEILGGRVKTLHPKVAGGLLGLRDDPAQVREMEAHGIAAIDMAVVNLYPFEQTVGREGVSLDEALENIDIGGPTMIRAAAKNHRAVAAVVNPGDYAALVVELDATGGRLSGATLARLAVKAFEAVAAYDAFVAGWLRRRLLADEPFGTTFALAGRKALDLRYGENPHQRAAFYALAGGGLGGLTQLQGKELSYNNLLDLDAAVGLARDLEAPAAVIVKHTNPCGAATAGTLAEAYARARASDPVSAFGGVVALAGTVDADCARELVGTFLEAVAAPAYAPEAREVLAAKKALRVVAMPFALPAGLVVRQVAGGLLVQDADVLGSAIAEPRVVTRRAPTDGEMRALLFAWAVAKHVKSNAIVFASGTQTVGVGAGQMSRVDSARIAAQKAVLPLEGTVVASDGFFPFRDGLDLVAEAGATAVIQPGGSVRDEEVIEAANEHGLAMVLAGVRHFRH